MARASRSSKKQPAFDPSELEDLIFSPAVGTGVGSHLVGPHEDFRVKTTHVPTVVTSNLPTVDGIRAECGDDLRFAGSHFPVVTSNSTSSKIELATVVESDVSTVADLPPALNQRGRDSEFFSDSEHNDTKLEMSTVVSTDTPTVDILGVPALVPGRPIDIPPLQNIGKGILWITEQGDLVPQGRVKRIRLAQDVINSAEESVYDTLWSAKAPQGDNRESFRIVQAGYDYLGKKTRLSKKTIQRIIAKLIDKNFITIERPADIYQRSSTVYRVFSYKIILEHHIQKGRSHVAKIGPGFSYVRPLSDPRLSTESAPSHPPSISLLVQRETHMATVVSPVQSTVPGTGVSTAVEPTTDTVPQLDPSTVVHETILVIGKDFLAQTTSSASAIYQALSQYGAVDDDILHRLIKNCKQQTPDCTEEEIIHFIQEKGLLVKVRDSRIYSPIGFLLTAVPRCLSGEAFRLYREEQAKRREAEAAYEAKRQAEVDQWRREQEAQLADPEVSEEDKQFIRQCLGI